MNLPQGNASYSELFRSLKEVHMVSFQCSEHATSDAILSTFHQCQKIQRDRDLEAFVSVVILDEVGLAEDSEKMALKALHPLLEDGCIGDEEATPDKKVGFIGISNWALDPAKMNRGILVSRGVPSPEELKLIAQGICSDNKRTLHLLESVLPKLVQGYSHVYKKQKRDFFGLRDFYSLVKMIYQTACDIGATPGPEEIALCVQVSHAGCGNFFEWRCHI